MIVRNAISIVEKLANEYEDFNAPFSYLTIKTQGLNRHQKMGDAQR